MEDSPRTMAEIVSASPFVCDICKKTYTRSDHLVRHYRTHTRERPFSCEICGKCFARRDLLSRHGTLHRSEEQRRGLPRGINKSRTRIACKACAEAKLRCSDIRPCERCVSKGISCDTSTQSLNTEPQGNIRPTLELDRLPLAEDISPIAYEYQQQRQNDSFGGTLAESNRILQPSGEVESRAIGSNNPQSLSVSNDPPGLAETCDPSNVMYGQSPDLLQGLERGFDDIVMGNFLHDIVNAEYSDNHLPGSSTGILPDVLHVGFNEFADFSSIFGQMAPAPTQLQSNTMGDINRLPNSHGGTETPAVRRAIDAGEQAFRESMWLWDPSMEDSNVSEQIHLTLPGYQSIEDHQARGSDSDLQLSSMSRDKLLLMILDTCDPRAQRQVVSRFPSMNFLSSLIVDFKARHSRQISPWIHFPTLDLENECEEFLAAIICAGAADSRRPDVRKLGFALQEAARLAIAKRFEEDNRNLRDLRSIQAFLVVLNVGLNSASRRKIEIAESYTLNLVTMLRRGGRFRNRWKGRSEANTENRDQDLEVRWRRWAEEESFKRLVYHTLFQDVQTSVALFRQPVTSYSEINLPMPCAAGIWEAESAEQWWQEILSRQGQPTAAQVTLPECLQNGGLLSLYNAQIDMQMSLRVVVSNFWLRVWQSIQMRPFLSPGDSVSRLATMNTSHQQLVAAGEDLNVRFSEGSFSMHPSVKMMLELGMMHLHVSLEDIQQLAGNEGEERAREAASRLRAWIKVPDSRHALFHAGQIAKATAKCPPQYMRGFHAVMVYHASLTMWAYALLATSQSGSHGVQNIRGQSLDDSVPIVWLDGEQTPDLRRFILLGTGTACIQKYSGGNLSGKDSDISAVQLTDAAEVMVNMAGLLSSRDESDYYCIPIASYLTRLMHSLAKASTAMKLSR